MVKGLELISPPLNSKDLDKIKLESERIFQSKGIGFRILEVSHKSLTVFVTHNSTQIQFSQKELAEITKAFFKSFFPEKTIHARPNKNVNTS